MKKLFFLLALAVVITVTGFAQAPQAFKYQAIARDDAGNILSVWDISLRVSLIQEGTNGQTIYTETHKVQTNIYGLINLIIGEGDIVNGDFSSIKWGENRHYIKMEMDIDGGEDYNDVGISQLYAVPYALYAEEAGQLKQPESSYKTSQITKPVKSYQSSSVPRGTPNSKISSSGNSWLNALTGNVGIGTTTPAGILDIAGAYHFPGTDGTSGQVLQTDGSGTISWENRGTPYTIGDFVQGGIVFWVDETGQHGLVCAKQDQSTGVRWYAGTYGYTQAKGDGPLAGEMNTSIIISAQAALGDDGSTYAARICNELQVTEGGKTYGDWYLPSKRN